MAPQQSIPVAADVLGTIGTVLWCVQLVPQIWTNWRTKKTDGLPSVMMFLWALCGVPFGVYSIVQNFNIPIQVQPQVFMALCLVSWAQTLVYHSHWRPWTAALTALITGCIFAGVETALILTVRPIYAAGNETPVIVIGIFASVLLAVGLLPPYGEMWKRRGRVVGINWIFLTMDSSGAFFSLMALVAQNTFDVLGGVVYIVCCALEIGIFSSHIIWRFRTRKIRKAAKAQGKTFDDIAAEHEEQGLPFQFSERKSRKERRKKVQDEESGNDSPSSEQQQQQQQVAPEHKKGGGDEDAQPQQTTTTTTTTTTGTVNDLDNEKVEHSSGVVGN